MRINSGKTFLDASASFFAFMTILIIIGFCGIAFGQDRNLPISNEGMIHVNGTDLYYSILGEGPPIIIVHGGPGLDHTYLLPQMEALASTHKLIFYDQRASGRSTSAVDTNSMTMDNFVEDLEGIRKAFHIQRMDLLGHSWGGLVSLFYAVKHPEHLHALVLVNSTPASSAMRDASFGTMAQRISRNDSIEQSELVRTEGFKNRNSATMEKFFRLLFRPSFYDSSLADSLTLTFDTSYATKSRIIQYLNRDRNLVTYDLFPKLKVIHCPTMIVTGDHDIISPDANKRLHLSIAGSTFIVLHNCGHFPYIEDRSEFFPLVERFLRSAGD
jgi:proline iminopeptidase